MTPAGQPGSLDCAVDVGFVAELPLELPQAGRWALTASYLVDNAMAGLTVDEGGPWVVAPAACASLNPFAQPCDLDAGAWLLEGGPHRLRFALINRPNDGLDNPAAFAGRFTFEALELFDPGAPLQGDDGGALDGTDAGSEGGSDAGVDGGGAEESGSDAGGDGGATTGGLDGGFVEVSGSDGGVDGGAPGAVEVGGSDAGSDPLRRYSVGCTCGEGATPMVAFALLVALVADPGRRRRLRAN
jgi:hypothetical protein